MFWKHVTYLTEEVLHHILHVFACNVRGLLLQSLNAKSVYLQSKPVTHWKHFDAFENEQQKRCQTVELKFSHQVRKGKHAIFKAVDYY